MSNRFLPIADAKLFGADEIYILDQEGSNQCHPLEIIDSMYFLRSEDEIIPALEIEMKYRANKTVNFIGCRRISKSCFELKMLLFDPEVGEFEYSMYLHRIKTVKEMIRRAKAVGFK